MNTLAIIFSYKRPAILEKCIESLFTQSKFFPKSVVIIDDGSGTDVLDVLQKKTLTKAFRILQKLA
jgi:glycosyltransferase involved in cell wall biosynthesis